MKKNNLFKIISIIIGIIVLLTWIIPAGQPGETGVTIGKTIPIGLWSLLRYVTESFRVVSIPFVILIMVIGGFYSILNVTGVYKKLITRTVTKFKNSKEIFLISSIILLAVLTSFTGMPLAMFLFFPFITSVLIEMGYDRLTIMAATVGSTLIGILGSTYAYNVVGFINTAFMLNPQSEIITRIFLLVISLFLLIMYIINNQNKIQLNKEFNDPLYFESKTSKRNLWPMITIAIVTIVILLLGTIAWSPEFKIGWFDNIHAKIMTVKLFKTPIIANILGNIPAFGLWSTYDLIALIVIATIVLAITYRIKFDHAIDTFVDGVKKVLPMALMIGLIHIVLYIAYYHPFYLSISKWLVGLTKSFNIVTMIMATTVNSIMVMDISYLGQWVAPVMKALITDSNAYNIITIIMQSIYAVTMLLIPTSVMLILGLMYLNIPYRTWLKYIYKLVIQLLLIIIVIVTIMALI